MRKIIISNSVLTDDSYKTGLSSAYSSGTTLTVYSNVSFAANDLAVIGELGEETTELKKVDSISGAATITLASALNFSHSKDTPVYRVAWDQVEIDRNQTLISTSAIQWDHKDTIYYDSPGTATDSYRFRFYNSVLATYSEYSPTITGAGYPRNSLGYLIREVRKVIRDKERKLVTDDEIIRFINAAQDIISGVRSDWWFLRNENSSTTTTAGTSKYALPSGIDNLGVTDTIRYNYNDGTTNEIYQLKFIPLLEYDYISRDNRNTDTIRDDWVQYYTLLPADSSSASGYYNVWPIPKTTGRGTFYVRYFEEMTDLDDVADTTQVPLPQIIEDYAIAMCYKILNREDIAKVYEDRFWGPAGEIKGRRGLTGLALLEQLNYNQKRPKGQPRSLVDFTGREPLRRLFGNVRIDRDRLHEDYF